MYLYENVEHSADPELAHRVLVRHRVDQVEARKRWKERQFRIWNCVASSES